MNKDQKSLEKIYESINNSQIVLLEEEKEFCRRVVEEIIKQSEHFKANEINPTMSLSNYLNFSGHRFGSYTINADYINKIHEILNQLIVTPDELEKTKQNVYIQDGYNHFTDATHLKLYVDIHRKVKDNSEITFHTPKMEVIAKVPCENKEEWHKLLQPTLELFIADSLFRARNIVMNNVSKTAKAYLKQIVNFWEWREEHLKYQNLRTKLPELEGIF